MIPYDVRLWGVHLAKPRITILDQGGRPINTIPLADRLADSDDVKSLAFSPVGNTLATVSFNSVEFWDGWTGQRHHEPRLHEDSVNSVAFSPDGSTLATASSDGTARLWTVDPPLASAIMFDPENPIGLQLSIEVRTWHTLENGKIRPLTHKEWRKRKSQLDTLDAPGIVSASEDVTIKITTGSTNPPNDRGAERNSRAAASVAPTAQIIPSEEHAPPPEPPSSAENGSATAPARHEAARQPAAIPEVLGFSLGVLLFGGIIAMIALTARRR